VKKKMKIDVQVTVVGEDAVRRLKPPRALALAAPRHAAAAVCP